jgi:Uma2 family endonuclease
MSPVEYLAFERASDQKHEYADGEVFAMSGGTFEHSAVATGLLAALATALAGRPCTPLTSDMRVKSASGRYFYPDACVICGTPQFEDEGRDTLLNPTAIFEVLSDSSEAYDRGDKFAHYETIASARDYVLASQKGPRIEVFTRQADQSWVRRVYGPGQRAALSSLECEIAVDAVYEGALSHAPG